MADDLHAYIRKSMATVFLRSSIVTARTANGCLVGAEHGNCTHVIHFSHLIFSGEEREMGKKRSRTQSDCRLSR